MNWYKEFFLFYFDGGQSLFYYSRIRAYLSWLLCPDKTDHKDIKHIILKCFLVKKN